MICCSFSSAYPAVGEDLFSINAISRYIIKFPVWIYLAIVNHLNHPQFFLVVVYGSPGYAELRADLRLWCLQPKHFLQPVQVNLSTDAWPSRLFSFTIFQTVAALRAGIRTMMEAEINFVLRIASVAFYGVFPVSTVPRRNCQPENIFAHRFHCFCLQFKLPLF